MPAKQIDGIIATQVEELQTSVSWLRILSAGLALASILLMIAVVILWFRTYDLQSKTTRIQTAFELKDGSVTHSKVADNAISFSQLSSDLQNQINNLSQITLNPVPGPAGANGTSGLNGTNGASGATGPAGPAGGVTAVDNGLSLVGTIAELGGTLIHDTALSQDGYDLVLDATGAGGNFVSLGEYGAGTALTTSGPGTKQIWYPKKSALRSGTIDSATLDLNTILGVVGLPTYTGDEWDDANIGDLSTSFGFDTVASGMYSTAIGGASIASGALSGSIGIYNAVTGDYSLAIGGFNYVEGERNVVIGLADLGFGGCGINSVIPSKNFVVGCGNSVPGPGDLQTILGNGNTSVGSGNFIAGGSNEAYAGQILIAGVDNVVYSPDSIAIGSVNSVDDTFTSTGFAGAFGRLNIVDGYQSMALGYSNYISGNNSLALGRNAAVNNDYSLSINLDNSNTVGMDVTGDHSIGINMDTSSYTLAQSNAMAIMGGDVGINTVAPAYTLEVVDRYGADTPASFTGTSGTCTVDTFGGGWSCVSDEKLKTNILGITGGLDTIMQLNGVTYNWKTSPEGQAVSGFIAQEVEKILPNLVSEMPDGTKSLNKDGILPYLVEAIKEQNGKIDGINSQLADQGLQINSLSEELKALTTRVNQNTSEIESLKARVKQLEDNASKPSENTTDITIP